MSGVLPLMKFPRKVASGRPAKGKGKAYTDHLLHPADIFRLEGRFGLRRPTQRQHKQMALTKNRKQFKGHGMEWWSMADVACKPLHP